MRLFAYFILVSQVLALGPLKRYCQGTFDTTTAENQYEGTQSFVCKCDESYCDFVPDLPESSSDRVTLVTSSAASKRFDISTADFSSMLSGNNATVRITIDASKQYQQLAGFGCAFTDAFGFVMASMSSALQNVLLKQYWASNGLRYTIGRVPMASCDFSERVYSYDDWENDFDLGNFSLATEDYQGKIPYLKSAANLSSQGGRHLKLFASPWSAPWWMKQTDNMTGGGPMKGQPGDEYYSTWAQYFVKFFNAYKNEGINFWGYTAENEPMSGKEVDWGWQAMYLSPEVERDFVKLNLGPAMTDAGFGDLKLMINDDQREFLSKYAETVYKDSDASKYVSGAGVHWYQDWIIKPELLSATHDRFPKKFILSTEACTDYEDGTLHLPKGPNLGNWDSAQRYARDIINDLNNWSIGWTDWNCALNTQGGPNWAGNYVDSPVIINSTEFYKEPMFYALGHFSAFIPVGSTRVKNTLANVGDSDLLVLSTVTTDQQRVVVMLNRLFDAQPVSLTPGDGQYVNLNLDPLSITTVLYPVSGSVKLSLSLLVFMLSLLVQ